MPAIYLNVDLTNVKADPGIQPVAESKPMAEIKSATAKTSINKSSSVPTSTNDTRDARCVGRHVSGCSCTGELRNPIPPIPKKRRN